MTPPPHITGLLLAIRLSAAAGGFSRSGLDITAGERPAAVGNGKKAWAGLNICAPGRIRMAPFAPLTLS